MSTPQDLPATAGRDMRAPALIPDLDALIASLEETCFSATSTDPTVERRVARRLHPESLRRPIRVTIPGAPASDVVNVSSSGVLIETSHRLCPGRTVDVFVRCDGHRRGFKATVVRSAVRAINPEVVYHTALQFETSIELPEAVS